MKRSLSIALCAAAMAIPAFAQNAAAPAAPAPAVAPIAPYELKTKSTFNLDKEGRSPFWPIGWVKQNPASPLRNVSAGPGAPQKFQLSPDFFQVSSVLLGSPALATINGRSYAEGDLLPVSYGDKRLRVVIRAVRDGGVWLDYEGQQLFVPLRRKDAPIKPATQPETSPDFSIQIPK